MLFVILHFTYLFLILSLFLFSLKTKRIPWISNYNLTNGKATHFLLLHFPSFLTGIILSLYSGDVLSKISLIISPIYTLSMGILTVNWILKKRIAKAFIRDNPHLFSQDVIDRISLK